MSMERCPECSSLASVRECTELDGCTAGEDIVRKAGGPFCRERSGLCDRPIGDVMGEDMGD